jgi:RNA polymerase sigma factor (sigma-70 family)
MSVDSLRHAVDHLRRLAGPVPAEPSDGELLSRFVRSHDQAAFAALVGRHGRLVFAACRRTLGDLHLAEDSFQAAFLALARQASALHGRSSLAGWLYTVAHRAALKARDRTPRPAALPAGMRAAGLDPLAEMSARELCVALDEEVARLPARYREPILLCCVGGLARDEAARRLGWSLNALRGRLERGRAVLRARLVKRGLDLPAALAAVLVADGVADAVPPAAVRATIDACALVRHASPGSGLIRAGLRGGGAGRIHVAGPALLIAVLGGAGLALMGGGTLPPARDAERATAGPAAATSGQPADLYGDPLPEGAVARMGSQQLRHTGLHGYAYLPDGKTVVSVGNDGLLRFWESATGRQVRTLSIPDSSGSVSLLSPDGKLLAVKAGAESVMREVATGKEIRSLPPTRGNMAFVTFSPDGKTLAEVPWVGDVRFLDWETGKVRAFALPKRKVGQDSTYHGSFSPDGKLFAVGGGWNEAVTVLEVATGTTLHEFRCYATVSHFTPDGKHLAVACMRDDDGKRRSVLRLFSLDGGKEVGQFPTGDENQHYYSLAFSPDGNTVGCGNSDSSFLADVASGRVLHRLSGRPLGLSFSPDGKTLVAHTGQRLRFWDAATGKERFDRPGEFGVTPVTALSPDGRTLASADWMNQDAGLWDAATGRLLRRLPLGGAQRYVRNLSFSPDGKTLIASQYQGFVQFWDVASGVERRTVQLNDPADPNRESLYFTQLHVSPDGKTVATIDGPYRAENDTRLAYWDAATGKPLAQHRLVANPRVGAWQADGKAVALALKSGVALVDVRTGTLRFHIEGVSAGSLALSPDSRLLAARENAASRHRDSVTVWETATGKEVLTFPTGPLNYLAVGADNRTLVATDATFLRVFDLATAKEVRRWTLPQAKMDTPGGGFVSALEVAQAGRRAITVLHEGTALVWNCEREPVPVDARANAPNEKRLAAWWEDLAGGDAARAYAAVWGMTEAPESAALSFLGTRLRPAPGPEPKAVRQLVKGLDSDSFEDREKAQKELENLAGTAEGVLREALTKDPSPEVRRRLESLLAEQPILATSPESLRRLRAMQVLERFASPEARRLLTLLAERASDPAERREAKAAIERLSAYRLGK